MNSKNIGSSERSSTAWGPSLNPKNEMSPGKKNAGRRGSGVFVVGSFGNITFFCGQCNTVVHYTGEVGMTDEL